MPAGAGVVSTVAIKVVADDPETDPALHPGVAFVATAGEPMAPLQETDAPFTAGSPLLSPLEPACLLFPLPLVTLRGPVGHRHPFDSHGLGRRLSRGRAYARETPVGWMPRAEHFDLEGLRMTKQHFEQLQLINIDEMKAETGQPAMNPKGMPPKGE